MQVKRYINGFTLMEQSQQEVGSRKRIATTIYLGQLGSILVFKN